jgi:hypothetical protein
LLFVVCCVYDHYRDTNKEDTHPGNGIFEVGGFAFIAALSGLRNQMVKVAQIYFRGRVGAGYDGFARRFLS